MLLFVTSEDHKLNTEKKNERLQIKPLRNNQTATYSRQFLHANNNSNNTHTNTHRRTLTQIALLALSIYRHHTTEGEEDKKNEHKGLVMLKIQKLKPSYRTASPSLIQHFLILYLEIRLFKIGCVCVSVSIL